MTKQATNTWCKVETLIFVIAIFAGIFSTKIDCLAWFSFLALVLVHLLVDRNYLEEWTEWLWK